MRKRQKLAICTFKLVWWRRFKKYRRYYGNHHPKAGQLIPNSPKVVKIKGWRTVLWDRGGIRETVTFLFR